jgi:selenocysteine-specific elongation factor
MSIELGFAPCLVGGLEVGIVDVPGHEHFIKTMVAGATGMDGVLLVVAADDGLMPQTREHLDILTLLGIRHGLVALTKIDRVGPDRTAEVERDIRGLVRGTFLQDAPIQPVSSVTGEGFDPFIKALQALVKSIPPRPAGGVFRLPVERAFSAKGFGTVITGIPVAGRVSTGDEVVLLPEGLTGRVSGLQVYGRDGTTALAGQCAAINVRHWEAAAVERGSVLTLPGYFAPEMWVACRVRLLGHGPCVLKNAAKVKFHVGTSEIPGTVYLMESDLARPGWEGLVQVRLDRPAIVGPCDRFILRSQSPPMTIGGGAIIEATPGRLKRTHPDVLAELQERAAAAPAEDTFVEYCLKAAVGLAATEAELGRRAKVMPGRVHEIVTALVAAGRAIALPGVGFMHRQRVEEAEGQVLAALADYHQRSPESPGMMLEEILTATGLAKPIGEGLVARLKAAGQAAERTGRLALASHRPAVADEDQRAIEKVERLFLDQAFSPPSPDEVAAAAGLPASRAAKAVRLLTEERKLVAVAPGLLFHAEAIARARQILTDFIHKEGQMESVKFKYLLGTSRKFAIPLLDHFDRIGVTRASGHTRFLRPPRPNT